MQRHIGWLLWLMMSLACSASEIVAWKVPLSRFAPEGLESEGVARRESAPEASPFFTEGDELWSLNAIHIENSAGARVNPEWVIWNAGTGRLVAKGDWAQITAIHERLQTDQLANHCRVKLSLVPVADGTAIPDSGRKPVAEVSVVSRSGQKETSRWTSGGYDVSVETEVTIGETGDMVDMRLVWNSKSVDQADFQVNTALALRSDDPVWVARDFDGKKKGFDLMAFAVVESFDGTSVARRVLIQKGKQTESLMPAIGFSVLKPEAVGETGWLLRIPLRPDAAAQIHSPNQPDDHLDPFAEPDPKVRHFLPVSGSVKPPRILESMLDHEMLDARKWLEAWGVTVKDGEFLGYDPLREMLYFYSPIQASIDILTALFTTFDGCGNPAHVVVSLEGMGQSRLIARSGQKASMSRTVSDKEAVRSFLIEPTLGENEDMMDLRIVFDEKSDPERTTHLNTAMTLNVGEWSEIAAGKLGDGEKTSLRVKAEVVRPAP